jgi:threonine/homoserine/homoserine lactone efflux protein
MRCRRSWASALSWLATRWRSRVLTIAGAAYLVLLFVAVLPQFVEPAAAWPVTAQPAVFASFHVAACGLVYAGTAMTARRPLRTRRRVAAGISAASGMMMVAIGVVLGLERVVAG